MDFQEIEILLNQLIIQGEVDDENTREKIIDIIGTAKRLVTENGGSSIPESCLTLLNEKAMRVLNKEMVSFIKRNPSVKPLAYTLVSDSTSANDLIYASIFQPYRILKLGLPDDLIKLFKQDNETRTEVIKKLNRKHLSDALNEFCSSFRLKKDICELPWSVLEDCITEFKLSDDEKRLIIREIWAKHSDLRQELMTSDFPGKLVEELEAIGCEKLNDLGTHNIEKYKRTFDLTDYQQTALDRFVRKSKSYFRPNGKWISRQLKGKEFVAKLEEAGRLLAEFGLGHRAEPVNYPRLLKDLGFRDETGSLDNYLSKENFDKIIDILKSAQEPPFESDEEMIAKVNDGAALHGLCIGMIEDTEEPVYCRKAPKNVFKHSFFCNVREIHGKNYRKNFIFLNKSDATKFKALVFELGLATAEKMVDRFGSYLDNPAWQNDSSNLIIAMSFLSCPTLSIELETEHLTLTHRALESFENIEDIADADEFLNCYGSHVITGSQQVGGISCNIIEARLPSNKVNSKTSVVKFANELMERSRSGSKFQQNSLTVEQDYESVEVYCKFQMDNLGPPISNHELFEETIKYCYSDWHVIERNLSNLSIHPIWKWLAKNHPDKKKQAGFLRDSWLRRVQPAETIDLVAKEIKKTVREIKVQQLEESNKKITSLLDQFRCYLNSNSSNKLLEDHVLCEELKEFFQVMTTFEALVDKQKNPWVTFVAEKHEFLDILDLIERKISEGTLLPKSISFLRNAFDENILSILENAGCKIKDTVRKFVKTSDEETTEMLAFKERCREVKVETLVKFLKETLAETGQEHSMLQWKFCSLIQASLRTEHACSPARISLQSMLTSRYNWSDGTFKLEMTYQALQQLTEEIESLVPPKTAVNVPTTLDRAVSNRNSPDEESFQDRQTTSTEDKKPTTAKRDMLIKSNDPAQHRRKVRKSFFDFLTDYSPRYFSNVSDHCNQMNNLKKKLIQCLRNRLSLNVFIMGANRAKIAPYDVLLELAKDFEPTGLHEIFLLLLERRLLLPIFNPLASEHYLALFNEIPYIIDSARPPIMLGSDQSLYRIALISCCKPEDSQASELLSNLFHVESFHKVDNTENPCLAGETLAIDLGIGLLDVPSADESQYNKKQQVMIAYIHGNFQEAAYFIEKFSDLLLIEDETEESRSFVNLVRNKGVDKWIGDQSQVVVWTPSAKGLTIKTEEENKLSHGFGYISIKSSLGIVLFNKLCAILTTEINKLPKYKKRTPLSNFQLLGDVSNSIQGIVPFDIDAMLNDSLKSVAKTRREFLLQLNFREQYQYEDMRNEKRLDEAAVKQADKKINDCYVKRKKDAMKVAKTPLLDVLLNILANKDRSIRVMALRQLEQGLDARTELELRAQQNEINRLYQLVVGGVKNATNPRYAEEEDNRKRYDAAKYKYRESMLHLEHLWREFSHLYVANPNQYKRLPELAAQHLLDGFSIELLDGDANLINLPWITAMLSKLNKMLGKKNRMFVISVMGVQSSGKSTLLNTMFGIKMRTSVGQCTRGINMQLLPVEGRDEYDYVLVLDTEGTRSPDFHGMEGNERRDNRMATLSILLADATIVVNPGENDAAVKEILPVVLLAYQGLQLAEKNGGRLSSMMFFVYNRIDVRQKEKLENIIQALANSLSEAFKTVREFAGRHVTDQDQQPNNCLFRHFKLDASNSAGSDVRILGQNKKSYVPPDNVPDPGYGEALVEFREHIHSRVTERRDETTWSSRNPLQLSDYLHQIWECLSTANFNLQFTHVLERTAFDLLEAEFQMIKHELSAECQKIFGDLRKTMIEMENTERQKEDSFKYSICDYLQSQFLDAISTLTSRLDERVIQIVSAKGREKWKNVYQTSWETHKDQRKSYWRQRIKYAFDNIFLYDQGVEKLKKSMRQEISEMYRTASSYWNYDDNELEEQFYKMMEMYQEQVKNEYPSVDIPGKIRNIYTKSPVLMRNHAVDVYEKEIISFCKRFMEDAQIALEETFDETISLKYKLKYAMVYCKEALTEIFKSHKKNSLDVASSPVNSTNISKAASELSFCMQHIHEKMRESLACVACYDDSIVFNMIEKTDQILQKHVRGQLEYSHHAVAHTYARIILEASLQQIQWEWEKNNSVPVRFSEPSNIAELRQFFFMVAKGANKMKLFGLLVKQKFSDLRKAFEAEMVAETIEITKRQNWLYDFKCTQNYMDEYLVQLIEDDNVPDLIRYVSEPKKLLDQILNRIILKIAENELTRDKAWNRFISALKTVIRITSADVLTVKNNRASHFVQKLKNNLLNEFKSEIVAQSLVVDFGDEYKELDGEPDGDFKEVCEMDVIEEIKKQKNPTKDKKFGQSIGNLVIEQLREENAAGAMPRCDSCCPWCKSMCFLAAGHDPDTVKHDTVHQPAGLGGVRKRETRNISREICSTKKDDQINSTWVDGKIIRFYWREWEKYYPKWVKPTNAQDWPLREYIFYNYHRDFAKYYGFNPCTSMIETYNRDLNSIKLLLEQDRKGPKIF